MCHLAEWESGLAHTFPMTECYRCFTLRQGDSTAGMRTPHGLSSYSAENMTAVTFFLPPSIRNEHVSIVFFLLCAVPCVAMLSRQILFSLLVVKTGKYYVNGYCVRGGSSSGGRAGWLETTIKVVSSIPAPPSWVSGCPWASHLTLTSWLSPYMGDSAIVCVWMNGCKSLWIKWKCTHVINWPLFRLV